MKLKTIIVEDEAKSREILRNYLTKYCQKADVVAEASNINEALQLINKYELDLVFLDVEMPFGNAFDLLEKLPDRSFETVFVTAYNHYAIDALNNHAAYYLMKPINIDELVKAVDYVAEVKERESNLEGKLLSPQISNVIGKITIPQQNGFQVLEVANIQYCKADDNYTEVYYEDKRIVVSKTLKYFEDALKEYSFSRIHKSYLVNINEVEKYVKGKGGSVILKNGKELSVSASRKAEFLSNFK